MMTITAILIAVAAGTVLTIHSLGRIHNETETLLDGYAGLLAEARERYRRELELRRPARRSANAAAPTPSETSTQNPPPPSTPS